MDRQFDCARNAQPRGNRVAVLLRRLAAAGTALAVAYLLAPVRPFDDATGFPMAGTGAHQDLAWMPLCHPSGTPMAAAHIARTDLESAEREVQTMRRG
jgi:hypothetical protein